MSVAIHTRFGAWTVLGPAAAPRRRHLWVRCDCGHFDEVYKYDLQSGKSVRCKKCRSRIARSKKVLSHGYARGKPGKLYNCWTQMKKRCECATNRAYHNYGGRGIKVCPEWSADFLSFARYIGEPPSAQHSIDRFPNNNGNYEPGNVRWATAKQQRANQRTKQEIKLHGTGIK